jgi:natural product biosynthesis luciferase-like monooxygenase protein
MGLSRSGSGKSVSELNQWVMLMDKIPQLSLFFFGADSARTPNDKYLTLFEASKFCDKCGFTAVWVPERHFQRFGGLYGSPSVIGAALAGITERLSIRAGSVVLPLQNPLRVVEEWAIVDNLSRGRVGLAAASGWHVNDFVLAPDTYQSRYHDMYSKLAMIQKLWRGEKVLLPNGTGVMTEVAILPTPIQNELPIWLTGQSDDTFFNAGKLGLNVLTANFALGHSLKEFCRKVGIYRDAVCSYHGRPGHVTLMVHAFVAGNREGIRSIAHPAMTDYLKINLDMQRDQFAGGDHNYAIGRLTQREEDKLIRNQVHNDLCSPLSLIGMTDDCRQRATCLRAAGADEIACLIDFGIDHENIMGGLGRLSHLIN